MKRLRFDDSTHWDSLRRKVGNWVALTGLLGLVGATALPANAGVTPPHGVSAINISVTQNDTGNAVESVTVESLLMRSLYDRVRRPIQGLWSNVA